MDQLAHFPGIEAKRLTALTTAEFARLHEFGEGEGVVVTLLLPMERKGTETRKNPIIFKNACNESREALRQYGGSHAEATLKNLKDLGAPPEEFWQQQEDGLVMLVGERGPWHAYLTPFRLGPFTAVGSEPYVAPLLRLAESESAYVLLLNLFGLRLFRATRWQVDELALDGVPRSLEDALRVDDPEKSLQSRRVTASNQPGPGGGNVAFHGHGITGEETKRKQVKRFFEQVDKGLATHFEDRERPLLLFGPDTEVALFREVNHYPHFVGEDIRINASNLSDDEIRATIAEAMAAREAALLEDQLELLNGRIGQGRGSPDLGAIVKAAEEGRIDTLFVRDGEFRYGVIHHDEGRMEIREPQPRDEDLIGATATTVALNGGTVYYLEDRILPEDAQMAAIYRY